MTNDRTKLLVHLRRIPSLLEKTFREGPDGSIEGNFAHEHPVYVHQASGFYLIGCLAYLVDEDGEYSWEKTGVGFQDFDAFCTSQPLNKTTFASRGITKNSMKALAEIRNAAVHNGYNASNNRNPQAVGIIQSQAGVIPGMAINNGLVNLQEGFVDFVRKSCLAVRQYHGDG